MERVNRKEQVVDTVAHKPCRSFSYRLWIFAEKTVCDKLPFGNAPSLGGAVYQADLVQMQKRIDLEFTANSVNGPNCSAAVYVFAAGGVFPLGTVLAAAGTCKGNQEFDAV